MARLDPREVLARTDVIALIGETVRLTKRGAQHYGLCPLHADRDPTLRVDPKKGFWFCPACQIGGDALDWIRRRDGIEFKEALSELAKRAGIDPTKADKHAPALAPIRPRFPAPRHHPFTPWGGQHLLMHDRLDRPVRILNAFPGRKAYLRMREIWPDDDVIWWPGDWATAEIMYLPPIAFRPLAVAAGSLADDYRAQALLEAVDAWRARYRAVQRRVDRAARANITEGSVAA